MYTLSSTRYVKATNRLCVRCVLNWTKVVEVVVVDAHRRCTRNYHLYCLIVTTQLVTDVSSLQQYYLCEETCRQLRSSDNKRDSSMNTLPFVAVADIQPHGQEEKLHRIWGCCWIWNSASVAPTWYLFFGLCRRTPCPDIICCEMLCNSRPQSRLLPPFFYRLILDPEHHHRCDRWQWVLVSENVLVFLCVLCMIVCVSF